MKDWRGTVYHSRNEYCTRLRKELAELFPYTLIERKAIGGWNSVISARKDRPRRLEGDLRGLPVG